ncbi:hypothetical protein FMEXI_28 [Fusarium mexicanum]|uniref:Uncharacterized protein n=1 Tax=Fusarium mexicanum TaxID=751941 RepID=A0A8H5JPP6_9HYPO|nr:hypothetical protein FMEXI_28 [Fusarium mexicanum]
MKGKEAQSFEGKLSRKDEEEAEERPNRLEIRLMQQFVFGTVGCTNLGSTRADARWLSQQLSSQGIVPAIA